MKKSIRRMAVLFAALFVVAMVTSVLFIALEAEHDCIGEDCPVCLQIAVCHSILNLSAGAAGIVLLAAFRRWIASFIQVCCKIAAALLRAALPSARGGGTGAACRKNVFFIGKDPFNGLTSQREGFFAKR